MKIPWLLRGRTGLAIGRWLDARGWEIHRVVKSDADLPLARVRIHPGQAVRVTHVTDERRNLY